MSDELREKVRDRLFQYEEVRCMGMLSTTLLELSDELIEMIQGDALNLSKEEWAAIDDLYYETWGTISDALDKVLELRKEPK